MTVYRDRYFKVSRRILDSSLWWNESGEVLKVFLALLALSQEPESPRDGTVLVARKALAAKCGKSEAVLDKYLAVLAGPDAASRTPGSDGRRIEILPNGFRILNYGLYHDEAKEDLLRAKRAAAGALGGKRSGEVRRDQALNPRSKPEANGQQNEATETETETETETTNGRLRTVSVREVFDHWREVMGKNGRLRTVSVREVFDHWREVMGKTGKVVLDDKRRSKITARLAEGYTVDDIRWAIQGCATSDFHMGRDRRANPAGTKHNDIALICRSGADLERFREMAPRPKPAAPTGGIPRQLTQEYREAERKAAEERAKKKAGE